MGEESVQRTRDPWSTRKKDAAPRGVYRHPSGKWAVRYTCGAGHIHKEKTGSLKSEAERIYHERRNRAQREPGWCPRVEAERERRRVHTDQARERARVTFKEYATGYLEWAKQQKRSWKTDKAQLNTLRPRFGDRKLDEIGTAEVERFRDWLAERKSRATVNRYLALLSGMYSRAIRLGLASTNPAKGVAKFRENNQRVVYLTPEEEVAIHEALPRDLRPHFVVSVNTGLRWSEQMSLRWNDVDFLTEVITVRRSKHGQARRVPMNSIVRSVLLDLGSQRQRPNDPAELVFPCRHAQADKFFPKAVEQARKALREAGKDSSRLGGFTWHGNRHTFASRLAMCGADLLIIKEVGGWKTLAMVQRYAHLTPNRLHEAVERLVSNGATELARN